MSRKNNRRRPSDKDESLKSKSGTESTISETKVSPTDAVSKDGDTSKSIPSKSNDPEWYSRDERLVKDGAAIPWNKPMGASIGLFDGVGNTFPGGTGLNSGYADKAVPGICSLVLKPSFGSSLDKTSPINVCANAFYTHVRYVNNGRKNYDPADLWLYAAAFADIYSFLCWLIRNYNYAFMYSQRNWYIGRDMLEANGMDPDDIITNLANYRYWINSIINKVSSFCLPGDIYFFKRRVFLYANYYLENPYANLRDQLYQFVPEGFMGFMYDSNLQAGKLGYKKLDNNGQPFTIAYLQNYFENQLMGYITGDEDFGLMSGDVLKAYGDNIMRIAQIGEDGTLLPVYDEYVLSQFKNAIPLDVWRGNALATYLDHQSVSHVFGDVEQTADGLLVTLENVDWSDMNYKGSAALMAANHVISVENPDPNYGDVLEATRLIPDLDIFKQPGGLAIPGIGCGTEIALHAKYTFAPHDAGGVHIIIDDNICDVADTVNGAHVQQQLAFKYAPLFYAMEWDTSTPPKLKSTQLLSNVDNLTTASNDMIKRVHEIALLSLFYVPGVAKIV